MAKTVILIECLILWGGPVLMASQKAGGLGQLLSEPYFLKHAIATVIVLAVLLTMADLGAGTFAGTFGALIVAGYLLAAAGQLGPAVEQAVEGLG